MKHPSRQVFQAMRLPLQALRDGKMVIVRTVMVGWKGRREDPSFLAKDREAFKLLFKTILRGVLRFEWIAVEPRDWTLARIKS